MSPAAQISMVLLLAVSALPRALDPLRARIVLEHAAAAIDGIVIAAPSPIRVDPLVLATASALLRMKVVALVVRVDGPRTAVAPNDREECAFVARGSFISIGASRVRSSATR